MFNRKINSVLTKWKNSADRKLQWMVLLPHRNYAIPVEVKSGKIGALALVALEMVFEHDIVRSLFSEVTIKTMCL